MKVGKTWPQEATGHIAPVCIVKEQTLPLSLPSCGSTDVYVCPAAVAFAEKRDELLPMEMQLNSAL